MLVLLLYKLYLSASYEQRAWEAYRCAALSSRETSVFFMRTLRCWIFFVPQYVRIWEPKVKKEWHWEWFLPSTWIQHSGTSVMLRMENGAARIHGSPELIPFRSLAHRSHSFKLCCVWLVLPLILSCTNGNLNWISLLYVAQIYTERWTLKEH